MNILSKGANFNTGHSKQDILTLTASVDGAIENCRDIPYREKP